MNASIRVRLVGRRREKATIRRVAIGLGRDPSIVSRDLRRNARPGSGDCRPHAAQACVRARGALAPRTASGLGRRWSPEWIVRRVRRDFPDRPEMHVVHETTGRSPGIGKAI